MATAKKTAGKKSAAKKSTGVKSMAKKSASKKTATKKAASRKPASKKAASKKSSSTKTPAKKSSTTKSAAKKSNKYGPGVGGNVETEMREMHEGKLRSGRSGKKVTNPKQAIAIGLSEARRAGKKVPPNPNK